MTYECISDGDRSVRYFSQSKNNYQAYGKVQVELGFCIPLVHLRIKSLDLQLQGKVVNRLADIKLYLFLIVQFNKKNIRVLTLYPICLTCLFFLATLLKYIYPTVQFSGFGHFQAPRHCRENQGPGS